MNDTSSAVFENGLGLIVRPKSTRAVEGQLPGDHAGFCPSNHHPAKISCTLTPMTNLRAYSIERIGYILAAADRGRLSEEG